MTMNGIDIFLIFLIAAAVVLAVGKLIRDKKRGRSSCGDCASCGMACDRREAQWK